MDRVAGERSRRASSGGERLRGVDIEGGAGAAKARANWIETN